MSVCRESGGSYQLLRVEVVAQGAALLVVLSAARGEPPPLRIDNFSPVAIMFHQVRCRRMLYHSILAKDNLIRLSVFNTRTCGS